MIGNTDIMYSEVPRISIPRTKMVIPNKHLMTFNGGDLNVCYLDQDILPGDTVEMKMSTVIRMATPMFPTMDNAFVDCFFFYIPTRLLWTHWREFWGENTNAWYQSHEYLVPQIKTKAVEGDDDLVFEEGSLADQMGLPLNITGIKVSSLPFRAYVKVWNDWFRNEALQQEVGNYDSDADADHDPDDTAKGGPLLKANKLHDYFTSCLPYPQKGPDLTLPLGSWAPVITRENLVGPTALQTTLLWGQVGTGTYPDDTTKRYTIYQHPTTGLAETDVGIGATTASSGFAATAPGNLWANLSQATAATLADLRICFALQHFYERQAYGSRYIEFIKNIFGVTSPDGRLQRSEFLGGKRIPLGIYQQTQSSGTTETSPLGQTGAFSHTADADEYFTKSFTEHGILLGLFCVRTEKSYCQGIDRGWLRRKFSDYYIPQLNGIGEQKITNAEIYAQGTSDDDEVFGYQERYAEYRHHKNLLTGAMRTDVSDTLSAWNYGELYESLPILGSTWIKEDESVIDRTLAVSERVADQFIGDFYFRPTYIRPMPVHSIPGLDRM